MAEDAPGSLLQRVGAKITDWVVASLLDFLVSGGVILATAAWIKSEWGCIRKPSCEVSGWSLGLLILSAVVTTYAALFFARWWYRARRELRALQSSASPPRFRDIEVQDRKLNLRWFIRRPPQEWLHWRNIARTVSPSAVHAVLDGPFHAAPGCNAPLRENRRPGIIHAEMSPQFDETCGHCGQRIFQADRFGANVWSVRAFALEELQRMQRNGTKLPEAQWSPPIVLENPEYWKLMLPPPRPPSA